MLEINMEEQTVVVTMDTPGYESLAMVLNDAYEQASQGKGSERHANDLPFDEQPMQTISHLLNSNAGALFQAMKKIQESQRMEPEAAIRELLGAINYVAGAIIYIQDTTVVEFDGTEGEPSGDDSVFSSDAYEFDRRGEMVRDDIPNAFHGMNLADTPMGMLHQHKEMLDITGLSPMEKFESMSRKLSDVCEKNPGFDAAFQLDFNTGAITLVEGGDL